MFVGIFARAGPRGVPKGERGEGAQNIIYIDVMEVRYLQSSCMPHIPPSLFTIEILGLRKPYI
jgi:hypothetical protein